MKKFSTYLAASLLLIMAFSTSSIAQFDNLYYDADNDPDGIYDSSVYNYGSDYAYSDQDHDSKYDYDSEDYDYDEYYDEYAYSRRIRRFHRVSPYRYNSRFFFYDDPFYYDPYYGNSWGYANQPVFYISIGSPYSYHRRWNRWNRWNRCNSWNRWSSWGYGDPWGYGTYGYGPTYINNYYNYGPYNGYGYYNHGFYGDRQYQNNVVKNSYKEKHGSYYGSRKGTSIGSNTSGRTKTGRTGITPPRKKNARDVNTIKPDGGNGTITPRSGKRNGIRDRGGDRSIKGDFKPQRDRGNRVDRPSRTRDLRSDRGKRTFRPEKSRRSETRSTRTFKPRSSNKSYRNSERSNRPSKSYRSNSRSNSNNSFKSSRRSSSRSSMKSSSSSSRNNSSSRRSSSPRRGR